MRDFYAGRTVLLTGASSGIGREMACHLAPLGARLILVARREDALRSLAAKVSTEAVVMPHDLGAPGDALALVGRLREADETVDVLINNAGFGLAGPFADHADEAVGMVDLNVRALTQLTAHLLPGMAERGRGGVLNVASLGAFLPVPHLSVYAATKAFVLSFTEALHSEMQGTGVHVSALCPGPVATEFGARSGLQDSYFKVGIPVEAVARAGLAGLAKNKARVVPGLSTKLGAFATRFSPPAFARWTARRAVDVGL
ncbi:MAG: SDR family oxidoreductase [Bacteroidota bacterium]